MPVSSRRKIPVKEDTSGRLVQCYSPQLLPCWSYCNILLRYLPVYAMGPTTAVHSPQRGLLTMQITLHYPPALNPPVASVALRVKDKLS